MTKKRQNIGKSKCHKDKVIKRQSNRKDRIHKKIQSEIRKVRLEK